MKKFFYLAAMLLSICATAQVQTINSQLKLTNVQPGSAADSVLVRGTNGIVKFRPASQFGTNNVTPGLNEVLQQSAIAEGFITLKDDLTNANVNGFYSGNQISLSNSLGPGANVEISSQVLGSYLTLNSSLSNLELQSTDQATIRGSVGPTVNILNFGEPELVGISGETTQFYLPNLGNEAGGQVLATQKYVDDAVASGGGGSSQSLQQTLQNGNVSTLPIYLQNGDNFVLELGKPYSTDQYYFNYSDRGSGGDFPAEQDVQLSANIEEGIIAIHGRTDGERSVFQVGGGGILLQSTDNSTALGGALSVNPNGTMLYQGQTAILDASVNIKQDLYFESPDTSVGFKFTTDGDPDTLSIFGPATVNNEKLFTIGEAFISMRKVSSNPNEKVLLSTTPTFYSGLFTEHSYQAFNLPTIPTSQSSQQILASWQQVYSITSFTSTTTANDLTSTYIFSGTTSSTLNLPTTAVTPGRIFYMVNNSSVSLTLDPAGSATISGSANRVVTQGKAIQVMFDGSNYRIISEF